MSLEIEWHPVARQDLLAIPWRAAARVDAAIMHFAATGQGHIKRISPTDPRKLRLFVSGAVALLFVDITTRTVHVGRVFSSA
jgi:hypothetical protein